MLLGQINIFFYLTFLRLADDIAQCCVSHTGGNIIQASKVLSILAIKYVLEVKLLS